MPFRINLLAEHIAAEELRRNDPIKRAVYIGVGLVVLMLLWIGLTQMKVTAAKSEMASMEDQLARLDQKYKTVKNNEAAVGEANRKLTSLQRYTTNRFYWGSLLNALQGSIVDKVRLTEIRSDHKYLVTEPGLVFSTNMPVPYVEQPAAWKFWASPVPSPTVESQVTSELKNITNSRAFTTNIYQFTTKITPTFTNEIDKTITAKVDFTTLPSAVEQVSLVLLGRDYGRPFGSAIDEFVTRLNAADFLQSKLKGRGASFALERPPQPQRDTGETNDAALFVPFRVEMKLAERVLTNE
ncbi:MAG: PilN domain-containing protein [Verrucomicrobiales bacterium]